MFFKYKLYTQQSNFKLTVKGTIHNSFVALQLASAHTNSLVLVFELILVVIMDRGGDPWPDRRIRPPGTLEI